MKQASNGFSTAAWFVLGLVIGVGVWRALAAPAMDDAGGPTPSRTTGGPQPRMRAASSADVPMGAGTLTSADPSAAPVIPRGSESRGERVDPDCGDALDLCRRYGLEEYFDSVFRRVRLDPIGYAAASGVVRREPIEASVAGAVRRAAARSWDHADERVGGRFDVLAFPRGGRWCSVAGTSPSVRPTVSDERILEAGLPSGLAPPFMQPGPESGLTAMTTEQWQAVEAAFRDAAVATDLEISRAVADCLAEIRGGRVDPADPNDFSAVVVVRGRVRFVPRGAMRELDEAVDRLRDADSALQARLRQAVGR
ncbi:MAG: hypothetical protein K8T90_07330 [Planctomycetes bacterium]|nr:hypothetical protein [Planctomycetota bacterium]